MLAPMKTNAEGISLIKSAEKFVDHVYPDAVGILTIYWGHVVKAGQSFDGTREQGEFILRKDLADAETSVSRLVRVPLTSNQFSALVSFTFNLGSGSLQSSTLRRLLNLGEYLSAAKQFPRWNKAGGRILRGLYLRRLKEMALFLSE